MHYIPLIRLFLSPWLPQVPKYAILARAESNIDLRSGWRADVQCTSPPQCRKNRESQIDRVLAEVVFLKEGKGLKILRCCICMHRICPSRAEISATSPRLSIPRYYLRDTGQFRFVVLHVARAPKVSAD